MNSKRLAWREFALMSIPCVLLVVVGQHLMNRPLRLAPRPVPVPAPRPTTFMVEVKRFRLENVNAANKKLGADTCMTVETRSYNTPPRVRWFFCRRIIATKNGKSSVVWYDMMPDLRNNPELKREGTELGNDLRIEHHLFKLRRVPLDRGELTFVWDALAKPENGTVGLGGETCLSLKELERAAKWGGLRLTKRLMLREAKVEQVAPQPTST